jgi:hypothetical protein
VRGGRGSTRKKRPRRKKRSPQRTRADYRGKPSTLPDVVTLRVHVPAVFAHLELDEVHQLARAALEERLDEIHAEREAKGLRAYMGPDRIRNQNPFDSAGDVFPDFALDPRIAPGHDVEQALERVAELVGWRGAYRICYEAWRQGRRRVLFPHGTYGLRVYHGARVEEPLSGVPPPRVAA